MRQINRITVCILLSLFAFHCLINFIWLRADSHPLGPDEIFHIQDYLSFHTQIKTLDLKHDSLFTLVKKVWHSLNVTENTWPRGVYCLTYILMAFFRHSIFAMKMTNMVYVALLIIAVYGIGRKCFSHETGLLAAFIVTMYPALCGSARIYGFDFPLTAMTALSVLCMLLSENFRRREFSVLFGIVLGSGLLVKGQIVFFIGGMLGWSLWHFFVVKELNDLTRRKKNIFIAIGISLLISSVWWLGNVEANGRFLYEHFVMRQTIYIPSNTGWLGVVDGIMRSVLFYPRFFIGHLSPLFCGFFIFALCVCARQHFQYKTLLFFWILFPYVVFTVMGQKNGRYLLPSYPAIALLTGHGLLQIKSMKIKKMLVVSVLVLGIAQFLKLTFNIGVFPGIVIHDPYHWYQSDYPPHEIQYCRPPINNNYEYVVNEIMHYIHEKQPTDTTQCRICLEVEDSRDFWQIRIMELLRYCFLTRSNFAVENRNNNQPYSINRAQLDYIIRVSDPAQYGAMLTDVTTRIDRKDAEYDSFRVGLSMLLEPIGKHIDLYEKGVYPERASH